MKEDPFHPHGSAERGVVRVKHHLLEDALVAAIEDGDWVKLYREVLALSEVGPT